MNRNGKRRQNINVSPCKRSLHSSVCRLEQPACCGGRRQRVLRRGSRVQTWANHPTLSATPADRPDSSWGSPSCCCTHLSVFLISQSGRRRALVRLPTALPTSPVLPLVDMESSVKGWPLRPLHLRIVLGHYFDPTPLTFRWLICDFWWMTFPSALQGEVGSSRRLHAEILLSLRTSCSCFIISSSPSLQGDSVWWASWISEVTLISRCDILFKWREHCVVHEQKKEQHLAPYHRRDPHVGEWTSSELLLDLLPYGSGGGKRREHKQVQIQPHVLRGRTPGFVTSLSGVLQLHTHSCFDRLSQQERCPLCSLSQDDRLEPEELKPRRPRWRVTQCRSAQSFPMWFVLVICTSAGLY